MTKLEKLITRFEEAESRFNMAEDILKKPHREDDHKDCERLRKQAHDEMIKLGHQIIVEENKLADKETDTKRDYFGDRTKAEQEQDARIEKHMAEVDKEQNRQEEPELTADEIVASDLSWEEKKELFAKLHAETKVKEKEQELAKDEDELERYISLNRRNPN